MAYTFGKKENKSMYAVNFFGEEYFGTPEAAAGDIKADSLMALKLAAKERMESMSEVIAELKSRYCPTVAGKSKPEGNKGDGT